MSIRMIAVELYRMEKEVDELKKKLEKASPESRADIEDQLRKATAERDKYRSILESKKEKPPYRRTFR